MKKPNFLKTRKEKRTDKVIRTVVAVVGLAVVVNDYQQRTEKKELENEKLRLQNRLLELEAQTLGMEKLAVQNPSLVLWTDLH